MKITDVIHIPGDFCIEKLDNPPHVLRLCCFAELDTIRQLSFLGELPWLQGEICSEGIGNAIIVQCLRTPGGGMIG